MAAGDYQREIRIPGGDHQTVPERLRLELPHNQAAAAVGPGDVLAGR
jgi:hypothetical protein